LPAGKTQGELSMKYWKTTLYNINGDLEDTQVVYLQAPGQGELLIIAMDTHSKPVKEFEEITESVYNANI
jgi:hypothetical protein|tara:strand:- start:41 stop:250 length:210 start_codon:yes stop_codon:yes gene_type:complete